MALQYRVETLEGVSESAKSLYVKDGAAYRLDVDGVKSSDEISGLTSALEKEREANRQAQKALKAFDGLDIDEARKALEKAKKGGDGADNLEAMKQAYEARIKELTGSLTEKEAVLKQEMVSRRFSASAFISEKLIIPPDMVEATFGKRFKVEGSSVIALNKDGNPLYSRRNPAELAGFDEALEILVDEYPAKNKILKGANASGTGSTGGPGAGGAGDWHKLTPEQRLNYARGLKK